MFGDRVYVYGSHDAFGAPIFCVNNYVCWSAPVDDLSDWRYEGVIYKKTQDSGNPFGIRALYAPDVTQGPDGRYYLYYAFDFLGEIGVDAKAVTDLIARNARVAQNQKEYNERYDALVSRYEDTERKRDAIVEQIDQIMIRRRKIERFIESVKVLPELITEFDESLWAGLMDSMTVHSKDWIVFRLTCGMEIEAQTKQLCRNKM